MNRTTKSLSTYYFGKGEECIQEALCFTRSDPPKAFNFYQNAMVNIIHAYKVEKKEMFREIYKQRLSSVFSDILEFQKYNNMQLSKMDDFYKLADEKQTIMNIELPNNSQNTFRASLYPTFNNLDFTVPSIEIEVTETNSQMPIYEFQQYQDDHMNPNTSQNPTSPTGQISSQNSSSHQNTSPSNSDETNSGEKRRKHSRRHHSQQKMIVISDKIVSIDNFTKVGNLGSGAFGNVYLATEKSTGKKFAIKELVRLNTAEDQKSLLREVESLAKAKHYAVLGLYGFALKTSNNSPYPSIVTDYMSNGSVQDVIDKKRKVTETQKYIILYGVAEAMYYLHDRVNIVHRDLKPANVMLNDNLEPIVGDFGLSKIISHEYMRQTQTAGSPVYMAPELLESREYSNKVDVYAFGVLCYEVLTCKYAFSEAKSLPDLITRVVNGKRPSLTERTITDYFKALIDKCWSHNDEDRPSFKEIARKLRKMDFLPETCDKAAFEAYKEKVTRK
ncbi:hypothetical protein TRFO_20628 [Tritrichomonas foetus]|uniref:mitogen-activated protein kinase kinase n=1 Tax=Tritrichomonas foetus TaxID=1144522 RepID=A0A1J4KJZ0_9EUKA|nr:hypothetical protein TRFO_20628 [Tritrichomonas foetus]|eukprot:OHT10164.1 hypothetical protein TRFO_20628 [Tritrichomonas foetus]